MDQTQISIGSTTTTASFRYWSSPHCCFSNTCMISSINPPIASKDSLYSILFSLELQGNKRDKHGETARYRFELTVATVPLWQCWPWLLATSADSKNSTQDMSKVLGMTWNTWCRDIHHYQKPWEISADKQHFRINWVGSVQENWNEPCDEKHMFLFSIQSVMLLDLDATKQSGYSYLATWQLSRSFTTNANVMEKGWFLSSEWTIVTTSDHIWENQHTY